MVAIVKVRYAKGPTSRPTLCFDCRELRCPEEYLSRCTNSRWWRCMRRSSSASPLRASHTHTMMMGRFDAHCVMRVSYARHGVLDAGRVEMRMAEQAQRVPAGLRMPVTRSWNASTRSFALSSRRRRFIP